MRGRVAVALCLLLAAGAYLPASAAGTGSGVMAGTASPVATGGELSVTAGSTPASQQSSVLLQEQPEADNTVTRIDLQANGTGTWTIQFRTRLATDAEEAQYRRFQESFRNNTTRYLSPFRERMTGVVAGADEDTAREMRAKDFRAETTIQEVPRRWGVVRYEFTWVGFAAVADKGVTVGDVFAGGFYIGEDDALAIVAPEGYTVIEAEPTPNEREDRVITWVGREDFADGQPRLVAEPAAEATQQSTDDGGDVLLIGLLAAAVLTVTLSVLRRREALAAARARLIPLSGGDRAAQGPASGGDGATPTAEPPDSGTEAVTAGELVSDEERVLALLRDRGGRCKQADVGEELDWSKSKTSRVLSRTAEGGRIRKIQIGRENVIELADEGEK